MPPSEIATALPFGDGKNFIHGDFGGTGSDHVSVTCDPSQRVTTPLPSTYATAPSSSARAVIGSVVSVAVVMPERSIVASSAPRVTSTWSLPLHVTVYRTPMRPTLPSVVVPDESIATTEPSRRSAIARCEPLQYACSATLDESLMPTGSTTGLILGAACATSGNAATTPRIDGFIPAYTRG